MSAVRIASRGSKLALAQAEYVRELLRKIMPGWEISIVTISTKGDRDRSDFLYKSNSVGFFTSEVEGALLDGRGDVAVHSLKDLPTAAADGLVVAAMPVRESVADALVARQQDTGLEDLPEGATVGTSSLRRIAQLKHLRPDLNCVPLRGNVETRISKVDAGDVDAAVLACAGLNRLGLSERISAVLNPEQFIPAPGQGALAIQIRADDAELAESVGKLDDRNTRVTAEAERVVLAALHGGCSIPLGVRAVINDEIITIEAVLSDVEAANYVRRSAQAPVEVAADCAETLAAELLGAGGQEILDAIRLQKEQ